MAFVSDRSLPTSRAHSFDAQLRDADAAEVVRRAREAFGPRLALVSAFGAESAVLLHIVAQVDQSIPVLFLDTGMLFGQTLDYRKQLAARLELTDVRDLRPNPKDVAADTTGDLWNRDPDACCQIRKVAPLEQALTGFDAWITGRKRFHGGERLRLRVVEDVGSQVRFNPLANWTKERLDAYAEAHALPTHPLVAQGFLSIGCWPCTTPVEEGQGLRAGRWPGLDKTECGIHTPRLWAGRGRDA